jgi:hypothetical protein
MVCHNPLFFLTGGVMGDRRWGRGISASVATLVLVLVAGPATAHRTTSTVTLRLRVLGGQGVVRVRGLGSCTASCTLGAPRGTVVSVAEAPVEHFSFSGWGAECAGTAPACVVALEGNRVVKARFARKLAAVSVTTSGQGTVRSDPAGINCPATCSARFPEGTPVMLVASPDSGWALLNGPCGDVDRCPTEALGDAGSAFAFRSRFIRLPAGNTLTVGFQTCCARVVSYPKGLDCIAPGTCTATFPVRTEVRLDAMNSAFFGLTPSRVSWSGACQGEASGCDLYLDVDEAVSVLVNPVHKTIGYGLSVAVSGPGTITSADPSLTCKHNSLPKDCLIYVPRGSTVVLREHHGRHRFGGWRGFCAFSKKRSECRLTMDENAIVPAFFRR